jgi:hypothetical protein
MGHDVSVQGPHCASLVDLETWMFGVGHADPPRDGLGGGECFAAQNFNLRSAERIPHFAEIRTVPNSWLAIAPFQTPAEICIVRIHLPRTGDDWRECDIYCSCDGGGIMPQSRAVEI